MTDNKNHVAQTDENPVSADFNPHDEFVILFDVSIGKRNSSSVLVMMVWRGPQLPRKGDTVHIGGKLVLKVTGLLGRNHVWDDGTSVTIDAAAINVSSPEEFMAKFGDVLEGNPARRKTLHADLTLTTRIRRAIEKIDMEEGLID